MNKNLIFRILGALSSALIVVSVFLPFFNVDGYSESLWFSGGQTNALYLPILIIVFGLIGIICFSINVKTEFAYSTSGAIIFYVVMTTVDYLNQDKFGLLSIGYYCLLVGAIFTGIMAFITNKRAKVKIIEPINEQSSNVNLNQVNNVVQTPIQPIETPIQPIEMPVQPIQEQNINEIPNIESIPDNSINEVTSVQNPVVNEFNAGMPSMQVNEVTPVQNPVVNEFNTGMPSMQVNEAKPVQNSVVNEFTTQTSSNQTEQLFSFGNDNITTNTEQINNVPLTNINNDNNNNNQVLSNLNNNGLDIFGQPTNK